MAEILDGFVLNGTEYELRDNGARQQIAEQVAASTDADANYAAEVVNARVGADGESYDSLGEAIRGQREKSKDEVTQLKGDIEDEIYFANVGSNVLPVVAKNRILYNAYNLIQDTKLQKGKYVNTDGSVLKSDVTYITPYIDISVYNKLYATNCGLSAFYDDKLKYITSFTPGSTGTDIPDNAKFARCTIFAEAFGKAGLFGNNMFPTLKSQIYLEDVIPPTFIVDKTAGITVGNRYKNLVDCIVDTYNTDCKIIVKSGTYDLYDEFATKYGESFTSGSTIFEGLKIQKQKVFCESGVTVKFEYSGDFFNITDYFSPIKFDGAGGEWHGGHIIAKKCRYAIHDDVFDTSDYSRTVIDGVVVDLNTSRNIAIGGGLGQSSDVTVTNCIFRQLDNTHGDCRAVYYHNAQTGANAVSNIKITGNYCNYGSIFIHSFGASTKKSTAIVSNNRCSAVTLFKQDGVIDNIELYQFNNKIETD